MKHIRAVNHRHVMSRLLKDQRFRRGYEEELEKLRCLRETTKCGSKKIR